MRLKKSIYNCFTVEFLLKSIELKQKSDEMRQYGHCQYENGSHSGPKSKMLRPLVFLVKIDIGIFISIRHVVVFGTSQWIKGRNLPTKWNMEYIAPCAIRRPIITPSNFIQMFRYNHHIHVDINQFISYCKRVPEVLPSPAFLSASNTLAASHEFATKTNWTKLRHLVESVHKQIWGHA